MVDYHDIPHGISFTVKFHGPTNYKPSRMIVSAKDHNGKTVRKTVHRSYDEDENNAVVRAGCELLASTRRKAWDDMECNGEIVPICRTSDHRGDVEVFICRVELTAKPKE